MNRSRLLVLPLAFACWGCQQDTPPEQRAKTAAEREAEAKLEGKWTLEDMSGRDPKKEGDRTPYAFWVTIQDGRLTIKSEYEKREGDNPQTRRAWSKHTYAIRLDPTQNPAAIDLVVEDDGGDKRYEPKGKKFLGIYQVDEEKNTLKLCWGIYGERPREFAPKNKALALKNPTPRQQDEYLGDRNIYYVLKRVK